MQNYVTLFLSSRSILKKFSQCCHLSAIVLFTVGVYLEISRSIPNYVWLYVLFNSNESCTVNSITVTDAQCTPLSYYYKAIISGAVSLSTLIFSSLLTNLLR